MNNIKDCNADDCVPSNNFNEVYKTFNGNSIDGHRFNDGQFILSDGSMIFIEGNYAYISVDVNGYKKKPNRLGRDLFMFQLLNNGKFIPMGTVGTTYADANQYCSETSTNALNGAGCTYKVIQEIR